MSEDRWEAIPRLLHDICDGPHGGFSEEVYLYVHRNGARLWYCRPCWSRFYVAEGQPEQPATGRAG